MAQHRIIPNVQTYLHVHISKSANADALCEKKNIPELWLLGQKAETARAGAPLNPPDDSSWNAANDDGKVMMLIYYDEVSVCLSVCHEI